MEPILSREYRLILFAAFLLAGCPKLADRSRAPGGSQNPPSQIVATERGARGGHLVFIDQEGARLTELTKGGLVPIRDQGAAWSPDGRWIVFESSRGRDSLLFTSLWIIAARPGAKPRRITLSAAIDRHPAWLNSSSLVYVSRKRGKSSHLWRLDLTQGPHGPRAAAPPRQLTDSPDNDESPTVSPKGTQIAFMRITANGKQSRLWSITANGEKLRQLTKGPVDITPAWSTDPDKIAFAAPIPKRGDYDIFVLDLNTGARRHIIDESFADQTGPRWSRDGRFLFCTSLYRAALTQEPVLSSVTFVDLHENPRVLRVLHDPAAVESRFGPTTAPGFAAQPVLYRNQDYRTALRQAIHEQLRRKRQLETD